VIGVDSLEKAVIEALLIVYHAFCQFLRAGSGWTLDKILYSELDFIKLSLTRGSSFLPTPTWLANKKGLINVDNKEDHRCFWYSCVGALNTARWGETLTV